MDEIYPKEITFLIDNSLLEWVGTDAEKRLRLTRRGRMLGNQVLMQFIEG
jgi:coproporphyrinogen III oxidase-like Fe-S oxidoreductase